MDIGGISAKIGLDYEVLWATKHLMQVMRGQYQSIVYEKISERSAGFDFCVTENGGKRRWYQSKLHSRHNNWTAKALLQNGVLNTFVEKLIYEPDSVCYFVTEDGCKELRDSCDRARLVENLQEFRSNSSIEMQNVLDTFAKNLHRKGDENVAFDAMKRCWFISQQRDSVIEACEILSSSLLQNSPGIVIAIMKDWLIKNVHKCITKSVVNEWIHTHSDLKFNLSIDPSAMDKIDQVNTNYLEGSRTTGFNGEVIDRGYADKILQCLEVGIDNVLVTGGSGSGKTVTMRQLLVSAKARNYLCIAIRMDELLTTCNAADVGTNLGFNESPVSILSKIELENVNRKLLIIDQVDAISEISGRSVGARRALRDLMVEAATLQNIKCVLACRAHDYEEDDYLFRKFRLNHQENDKVIWLSDLNWLLDVTPILNKNSIEVQNESMRDLLKNPLHLSMYLTLKERNNSYYSTTDLIEHLLQEKQKKYHDNSIYKGLEAIADAMSEEQAMRCPADVLNDQPGMLKILISEDLIVVNNSIIHFVHEIFFDYVFAYLFHNKNQNIFKYLTEGEQSLFCRSQVTQILQYARQKKWSWYTKNLRQTLNSLEIRVHIRYTILQWLSKCKDPKEQELEILLDTDGKNNNICLEEKILLFHSEVWFNKLIDSGIINDYLKSGKESLVQRVLTWLGQCARYSPEQVASILNDWWIQELNRDNDICRWFALANRRGDKLDEPLINLLKILMTRKPSMLFGNDNQFAWKIMNNWIGSGQYGSAHLLEVYMKNWFEWNKSEHIFGDKTFRDGEYRALEKLSKVNPGEFLQGIMNAMVKSMKWFTQDEQKSNMGRKILDYAYEKSQLLGIVLDAFAEMARYSPEQCIAHLQRIDPLSHHIGTFIWLLCIKSSARKLHKELNGVWSSKFIFTCGRRSNRHVHFAEAVRALCDEGASLPKGVEKSIINHFPERHRASYWCNQAKQCTRRQEKAECKRNALKYLNALGKQSYQIMQIIGIDEFSDTAKRRYWELERKFPKSTPPAMASRRLEAKRVSSPIGDDVCKKMSDKQWIMAMKKYCHQYTEAGDRMIGGMEELARVLEQEVKNNPERYIVLLAKNMHAVDIRYVEACIDGLRSAEKFEYSSVMHHILDIYKNCKSTRVNVMRFAGAHPELFRNQEFLDFALNLARWGVFDDDIENDLEKTENHVGYVVEQYLSSSRNIVTTPDDDLRSLSWTAIATGIQSECINAESILDEFSKACDEEPHLIVRVYMYFPLLTFIGRIAMEKLMNIFEKLYSIDDDSKINRDMILSAGGVFGLNFLNYMFEYIADHYADVLDNFMVKLKTTKNESMRMVALWLDIKFALHTGKYDGYMKEEIQRSEVARVLWTQILQENICIAQNRSAHIEEVSKYFNDICGDVRQVASCAFDLIDKHEGRHFEQLAKNYIGSIAFFEYPEKVLQYINRYAKSHKEYALLSVEIIIEGYRKSQCDVHCWDEINQIVLREYEFSQGHAIRRKRVLDIVDTLIEFGELSIDNLDRFDSQSSADNQ